MAVAQTAEEAFRLALPQALAMAALRSGLPLGPQRLVEDAEEAPVDAGQRHLAEAMLSRWVVDDAPSAHRRLIDLATTYGVDEVMVHPVAGAFAGTPAAGAPAREATLRLLAR